MNGVVIKFSNLNSIGHEFCAVLAKLPEGRGKIEMINSLMEMNLPAVDKAMISTLFPHLRALEYRPILDTIIKRVANQDSFSIYLGKFAKEVLPHTPWNSDEVFLEYVVKMEREKNEVYLTSALASFLEKNYRRGHVGYLACLFRLKEGLVGFDSIPRVLAFWVKSDPDLGKYFEGRKIDLNGLRAYFEHKKIELGSTLKAKDENCPNFFRI